MNLSRNIQKDLANYKNNATLTIIFLQMGSEFSHDV